MDKEYLPTNMADNDNSIIKGNDSVNLGEKPESNVNNKNVNRKKGWSKRKQRINKSGNVSKSTKTGEFSEGGKFKLTDRDFNFKAPATFTGLFGDVDKTMVSVVKNGFRLFDNGCLDSNLLDGYYFDYANRYFSERGIYSNDWDLDEIVDAINNIKDASFEAYACLLSYSRKYSCSLVPDNQTETTIGYVLSSDAKHNYRNVPTLISVNDHLDKDTSEWTQFDYQDYKISRTVWLNDFISPFSSFYLTQDAINYCENLFKDYIQLSIDSKLTIILDNYPDAGIGNYAARIKAMRNLCESQFRKFPFLRGMFIEIGFLNLKDIAINVTNDQTRTEVRVRIDEDFMSPIYNWPYCWMSSFDKTIDYETNDGAFDDTTSTTTARGVDPDPEDFGPVNRDPTTSTTINPDPNITDVLNDPYSCSYTCILINGQLRQFIVGMLTNPDVDLSNLDDIERHSLHEIRDTVNTDPTHPVTTIAECALHDQQFRKWIDFWESPDRSEIANRTALTDLLHKCLDASANLENALKRQGNKPQFKFKFPRLFSFFLLGGNSRFPYQANNHSANPDPSTAIVHVPKPEVVEAEVVEPNDFAKTAMSAALAIAANRAPGWAGKAVSGVITGVRFANKAAQVWNKSKKMVDNFNFKNETKDIKKALLPRKEKESDKDYGERICTSYEYVPDFIPEKFLSIYSLKHLYSSVNPFIVKDIITNFDRDLSLEEFSRMDRFRLLRPYASCFYNLKRDQGRFKYELRQLAIPGLPTNDPDYTASQINALYRFHDIVFSTLELAPPNMFEAIWSFNNEKPSKTDRTERSESGRLATCTVPGKTNQISIVEDLDSISVGQYDYYREICKLEIFHKGSRTKLLKELEDISVKVKSLRNIT